MWPLPAPRMRRSLPRTRRGILPAGFGAAVRAGWGAGPRCKAIAAFSRAGPNSSRQVSTTGRIDSRVQFASNMPKPESLQSTFGNASSCCKPLRHAASPAGDGPHGEPQWHSATRSSGDVANSSATRRCCPRIGDLDSLRKTQCVTTSEPPWRSALMRTLLPPAIPSSTARSLTLNTIAMLQRDDTGRRWRLGRCRRDFRRCDRVLRGSDQRGKSAAGEPQHRRHGLRRAFPGWDV